MSNLAPHTTLVFHNPELKIHVFHSPSDSAGEAVNSLVLETSASLVLFDLPVLSPVAEQIASFSKNLNKPIRKIVISHGHPDHWFGLWPRAFYGRHSIKEKTCKKDLIKKSGLI